MMICLKWLVEEIVFENVLNTSIESELPNHESRQHDGSKRGRRELIDVHKYVYLNCNTNCMYKYICISIHNSIYSFDFLN